MQRQVRLFTSVKYKPENGNDFPATAQLSKTHTHEVPIAIYDMQSRRTSAELISLISYTPFAQRVN